MLYRCETIAAVLDAAQTVHSRPLPINDAIASSAQLSAVSPAYLLFPEASLAFPAKILSTNQTHPHSYILRRVLARFAAVDCFDTKNPSPLSETADLSR
jgi:hypothetical protein